AVPRRGAAAVLARGRAIAALDRLDVADAADGHLALAVLDRLDRVVRLERARGPRDRAEALRDERERARLVDTARDHEHRVVRLVVLAIERPQPLDRHVLDIAAAADRRVAVPVPDVRRAEQPPLQNAERIVLARLELVADDGHLAVEIRLRDQ